MRSTLAFLALLACDPDPETDTDTGSGETDSDPLDTEDTGEESDSVDTVDTVADSQPPEVLIDAPRVAAAAQRFEVSAARSTDPDGDALSFRWELLSGQAQLEDANAAVLGLVARDPGPLSLRVEVSDGTHTVSAQVELRAAPVGDHPVRVDTPTAWWLGDVRDAVAVGPDALVGVSPDAIRCFDMSDPSAPVEASRVMETGAHAVTTLPDGDVVVLVERPTEWALHRLQVGPGCQLAGVGTEPLGGAINAPWKRLWSVDAGVVLLADPGRAMMVRWPRGFPAEILMDFQLDGEAFTDFDAAGDRMVYRSFLPPEIWDGQVSGQLGGSPVELFDLSDPSEPLAIPVNTGGAMITGLALRRDADAGIDQLLTCNFDLFGLGDPGSIFDLVSGVSVGSLTQPCGELALFGDAVASVPMFGQGLWWSTWDGVSASPADARGYAGRGGRPVARFGEHLVVAGPGGAWVLPREADLGRWGGAQPYVGVEDPVTVRADAGVLVVERATDTFGPTDLLRCEPGTGPLACEPFGPSAPRLHGVLHGSELVVAGYDHGLVVYDATDLPASLVGGWYGAVEEWSPTRLARVGDRVAVWDSASEQILHFDISDPSAPVIVPDFPALFASDELSAVGSWFFLAGDDAAALIDPADPTTPVWQAPSDAESPWVGSAALAGDALWLVGSEVEAFGVGTNGPAASMGEVMRWGPPERPLGTAGWRHTPAATEGTSAWATDYGFGLLGLRRDALGQAEAWARLPVGTHGITTVAVAAGAPWWTDGEGTLRTFARFQAPELTLDPSTPPRVGGEVLADVRFTPPTSGPSKLGCRVAVGACELSEVDLEAGTAKLRWLLPDFIGRHEVAVWWAAPDALMFGRLGVETPAE